MSQLSSFQEDLATGMHLNVDIHGCSALGLYNKFYIMPLVLNEFNCVNYEYPCKMSECRFNQW